MSNASHGIGHLLWSIVKGLDDVNRGHSLIHFNDVDLIVPLAVGLGTETPVHEIWFHGNLVGIFAFEYSPDSFPVDVRNIDRGFKSVAVPHQGNGITHASTPT